MSRRVLILGTGLIGASIGLALKSVGPEFEGTVLGWDANPAELAAAFKIGAIDGALSSREAALEPGVADIYVLATPVLAILDWMEQLAPVLSEAQLVTDAGSTKQVIAEHARKLFNQPGRARFLPGHPMAGKESGGAALAEATLFHRATWLFTPIDAAGGSAAPASSPVHTLEDIAESTRTRPLEKPATLEDYWRVLVSAMGANLQDIGPAAHDEVCAWVSHLPQMLSTALAALLEDTFADDPQRIAAVQAIGGRALRETTRLGSSPYSMWRDVAMTNTEAIEETLLALEQRLAHIRENLRTPELREQFAVANRFRATRPGAQK
ncbi:MAG TPA: prephenate dehydrogenase/arogenate dehydrogenase family protein [Acidobacteriaceae bacterium]|jgi:prephenate dehydrogenase